MWHMHAGTAWWILMSLGMFAFWGLVIWAIWSLVRSSSGPEATPRPESAREIIRRRLARGEITAAEYDELAKKLQTGPPAPV